MKPFLTKIIFAICAVALLSGCAARKRIVYVQGAAEIGTFENQNSYSQKIKADDRLSIIVNCKEPELAAPFNMQLNQRAFTGGENIQSYAGGSPMTFWVNTDGEINYPTIGMLHVAGMTRKQLQDFIQNYLVENGYIQDPVVVVEFNNATISILGEVGRPGQYSLSSDRLSLFDAIALAGDLTIYGERDKVRLIREEEGKQHVYTLNLTDPQIINSEFYYLEQNDVLIVEPNASKASNREVSSLYSFAISLTSLALTIATFIRSFK